MKAATYRTYGPPQVIVTSDLPRPRPGAREILVRSVASTVSSADWRARSLNMPAGFGPLGRPAFGLLRPRQPILGTELSGVVESIGRSVTRFRPGDEVFGFTGAGFGCHAQYRVLPQDGLVVHKPANLTWMEAAALSFGGTTALYFLQSLGGVRRGETVLILGASGCVGSAAVQLAHHFGARVTAVCATANMELVRRLGAGSIIDYKTQDFTATDQTFDIILDTAGIVTYRRCAHLLKPGGRLLIVQGTLAQALGLGSPDRASGHRSLGGVARVETADLRFLADLAMRGVYRPVIDRCFPLARAAEAHAYVAAGHKVGSVGLTIATPPASNDVTQPDMTYPGRTRIRSAATH